MEIRGWDAFAPREVREARRAWTEILPPPTASGLTLAERKHLRRLRTEKRMMAKYRAELEGPRAARALFAALEDPSKWSGKVFRKGPPRRRARMRGRTTPERYAWMGPPPGAQPSS